jgi:hypothetical protein
MTHGISCSKMRSSLSCLVGFQSVACNATDGLCVLPSAIGESILGGSGIRADAAFGLFFSSLTQRTSRFFWIFRPLTSIRISPLNGPRLCKTQPLSSRLKFFLIFHSVILVVSCFLLRACQHTRQNRGLSRDSSRGTESVRPSKSVGNTCLGPVLTNVQAGDKGPELFPLRTSKLPGS